jgi:CHAT domain-containing protein
MSIFSKAFFFGVIVLHLFIYKTSLLQAQSWQGVGNAGFTEMGTTEMAFTLDGKGVPYVVYKDEMQGKKLTVKKLNGTSWQTLGNPGFSKENSGFISIKVGRGDNVLVAYTDYGYDNKVTVMKYKGGQWQSLGIPGFSSSTTRNTTLALDKNDVPYVGFMDYGSGKKASVMKYNGSNWELVGQAGFSDGNAHCISLALDQKNVPYTGYLDIEHDKLCTVKKYNGSNWENVGRPGFTLQPIGSAKLAFDENNNPYLCYLGQTDGTLNNYEKMYVLRFKNGQWDIVGKENFTDAKANHASMTILNNMPYVSYSDEAAGGRVTVMRYNGTFWLPLGNKGFSEGGATFTNIEATPSGEVYVAYIDKTLSNKITVKKFTLPSSDLLPIANETKPESAPKTVTAYKPKTTTAPKKNIKSDEGDIIPNSYIGIIVSEEINKNERTGLFYNIVDDPEIDALVKKIQSNSFKSSYKSYLHAKEKLQILLKKYPKLKGEIISTYLEILRYFSNIPPSEILENFKYYELANSIINNSQNLIPYRLQFETIKMQTFNYLGMNEATVKEFESKNTLLKKERLAFYEKWDAKPRLDAGWLGYIEAAGLAYCNLGEIEKANELVKNTIEFPESPAYTQNYYDTEEYKALVKQAEDKGMTTLLIYLGYGLDLKSHIDIYEKNYAKIYKSNHQTAIVRIVLINSISFIDLETTENDFEPLNGTYGYIAKANLVQKMITSGGTLYNYLQSCFKTGHFKEAEVYCLAELDASNKTWYSIWIQGYWTAQKSKGLENMEELIKGSQGNCPVSFNVPFEDFKREIQKRNGPGKEQIYLNLARNYELMKMDAKADSIYTLAINAFQESYLKETENYKEAIYTTYANYLARNRQYEKAAAYQDSLLQIKQKTLETAFPSFTENQKMEYFSQFNNRLNQYYLVLAQTPATSASKMATLSLQYKGLVLDELRHSQKVLNAAHKDAVLGRLLEDIRNLRSKASALEKTAAQDYSAQKQLNEVMKQLDPLETEVSRKVAALGTIKRDFTSQEITKKLKGTNEAYVDILRIEDDGFDENEPIPMYYAILYTFGSVTPKVIKIASGTEFESKKLKYYQNSIKYKNTDQESYNVYWKPIADALKGVNKIYFSPDGVYHLLNTVSFLNPITGKYLNEEITLFKINSGRDIISNTNQSSVPDESVFIGYPDYKSGSSIDNNPTRSVDVLALNDSTRAGLSPLPGTLTEVQNASATLQGVGKTTKVLTGANATETTIKSLTSPYILHIATHGLYYPGKLKTNAMLQSKLALAGAAEAKTVYGISADDGLLTAYEASQLSLDNTKLVILSACETGLGKVVNGDGVYGLQRAFQVAGATYVISALWKVNDEATSLFMTTFYKNFSLNFDVQKSYNGAINTVKLKYPHPYYWGAFALSGAE